MLGNLEAIHRVSCRADGAQTNRNHSKRTRRSRAGLTFNPAPTVLPTAACEPVLW